MAYYSTVLAAGVPLQFKQITVSTAAVGLSAPQGANAVVIITETDNIRWRDDGTAPTSTVGMICTALNVIQLEDATQIANFQAIRDQSAATDVTLNCSFYAKK